MKTIWKYRLPTTGRFTLDLPVGYTALHLGVQDQQPHWWLLVDSEAPTTKVSLRCYGTGHEVDEREGAYLGTVLLVNGAFVLHYFRAL